MSFSLDRFRKLMNLTKSDNDNEALNAIRAANRMLESAGQSWEKMIGGATPPTPPRPQEDPMEKSFRETFGDEYADLFKNMKKRHGRNNPYGSGGFGDFGL